MEFRILSLMPLPETARKLVTQFLREPHPTANLIQALKFEREEAQESDEENEQHRIPECLKITGPGVRIKDLSTPWPHTYVIRHKYTPYNPRWSAWETTYCLWFSYDEQTGELNPQDDDDEDVDSSDENLISNRFMHSATPWG